MVAATKAPKLKDAVRTARFEVYRIETDDPKPVRARWWDLCDQARQVTNGVWQAWFAWHYRNNSIELIRDDLAKMTAWHRANETALQAWTEADEQARLAWVSAGKPIRKFKQAPKPEPAERPKGTVQALSPEIDKFIYDELSRRFPTIHTNSRESIRQTLRAKILKLKSARGNLPGWMSILLCRQNIPSSTRPIPLPIPAKNTTLIPPSGPNENFRLEFNADRIPITGKKSGKSTVDTIQLLTKRRGIAAYEKLLHRMVIGAENGGVEFRHASLEWDDRKKKWFCLIAYRMPATGRTIEGDGTAILYPNYADQEAPWTIEADGRRSWRGGNGRDVAHKRHSLMTSRLGRRDTYHHAGSANKGHGRRRATKPVDALSAAWKDFVRTKNQNLAKRIAEDCAAMGCSTLVYRQPIGDERCKMMLECAGKDPKRPDPTGWDWHQVGTTLAVKCQEYGIHLKIEKFGAEDAEAA